MPLVFQVDTSIGQDDGGAMAFAAKQEASPRKRSKWVALEVVFASLIAIGLCGAYLYFLWPYTPLADANNNVNGYLVTGKLLARQGNGLLKPESPFEFVGWMWNMADPTKDTPGGGAYYSKYPLGLPVLVALVCVLSPEGKYATYAHYLSPTLMTLGMLGVFAIARQIMNSVASLIAMTLVAISPVILLLSTDARSHAAAVCFVTWGVALALWFARSGRIWVGLLAGLVLGFAVIVRYSEGLLVIPLAVACVLTAIKQKGALRILGVLTIPIVTWAVFPAMQVVYNLYVFGDITGYDATKESLAFNPDDLTRKWTDGVNSLYNTGAYFVLPLGIAGLLAMLRWKFTAGVMLVLWFVPGLVICMAYYWGQQMVLWDFLRFFATLLAPVYIGAIYLLNRVTSLEHDADRWELIGTLIVKLLALATIAGWAGYMTLSSALVPLQRNRDMGDNLLATTNWINEQLKIPDAAAIFGDSQRLLNHLQFARNFSKLYGGDWVLDPNKRVVPPIRTQSDSDANPIQPQRREHVEKHLGSLLAAERAEEARKLISAALDRGEQVWVILKPEQARLFRTRVLAGSDFQWEQSTFREPIEAAGQLSRRLAHAMSGGKDPTPRTWQAIHVTRKPSTTQPATLP